MDMYSIFRIQYVHITPDSIVQYTPKYSIYNKQETILKNNKTQEQLIAENFYEYIRTKAKRYIDIGFNEYRKADAFNQPSCTMTKERLLQLIRGCKQVIGYRGQTPETAFKGLEIQGFYQLMELLHFQVIKQRIEKMKSKGDIVDELHIEHIMSGQKMKLYNKVKSK